MYEGVSFSIDNFKDNANKTDQFIDEVSKLDDISRNFSLLRKSIIKEKVGWVHLQL